jgi:signal-transduction protein with cAMP-binding, CBS, and nucleotidyltransferase domain
MVLLHLQLEHVYNYSFMPIIKNSQSLGMLQKTQILPHKHKTNFKLDKKIYTNLKLHRLASTIIGIVS